MLHGNPTWSFIFRDLIQAVTKQGGRAIALDNLGSGYSDKPQNWPYRLQGHIDNLAHLVDTQLKLPQFDLVLHDWGGPIGMGYAVDHPERIRRIILMNTAAFRMPKCPAVVSIAGIPGLGAFLVRGLNLFVRGSLALAPAKKLSPAVKAGMGFPYRNWHDRIATQAYVLDLPMKPSHPTYHTFVHIEENLHKLAQKTILLCWGEKDFCFGNDVLDIWKKIYPQATVRSFPDCAHYLMEDNPQEIIPTLADFLR